MLFFRKKTLADSIVEGSFDDRTLAKRMKEWMLKGGPGVARRAIKLYEKQPQEKREAFARHGLTEEFVNKQKKCLNIR